jgi:hypothetical protein
VPKPWLRPVSLVAFLAVAIAGCGSGGKSGTPSTTASTSPQSSASTVSTIDPNTKLNSIPYNVGETIGLPGGWRVQVVRVQRGYSDSGLPSLPAGQEHVAVDVRVIDDGGPTVSMNAAALFVLYDAANDAHPVVARPGVPNGLDGRFSSGTNRTGRLVFAAPVHSQLRMILDGQPLGSQRSLFQIDPPKVTPQD